MQLRDVNREARDSLQLTRRQRPATFGQSTVSQPPISSLEIHLARAVWSLDTRNTVTIVRVNKESSSIINEQDSVIKKSVKGTVF